MEINATCDKYGLKIGSRASKCAKRLSLLPEHEIKIVMSILKHCKPGCFAVAIELMDLLSYDGVLIVADILEMVLENKGGKR